MLLMSRTPTLRLPPSPLLGVTLKSSRTTRFSSLIPRKAKASLLHFRSLSQSIVRAVLTLFVGSCRAFEAPHEEGEGQGAAAHSRGQHSSAQPAPQVPGARGAQSSDGVMTEAFSSLCQCLQGLTPHLLFRSLVARRGTGPCPRARACLRRSR